MEVLHMSIQEKNINWLALTKNLNILLKIRHYFNFSINYINFPCIYYIVYHQCQSSIGGIILIFEHLKYLHQSQPRGLANFQLFKLGLLIYNQIKMNYLSQVGTSEEVQATGMKKLQSRDYKCPCGKTYLSYAALFTHIKQKHQGKAPGQIQKPKIQSKPRGRPPHSSKNKMLCLQKSMENSDSCFLYPQDIEENGKNLIYEKNFRQIYAHLAQLYYPEDIDMGIWEKVNSFKILEQFIDENQEKKKPQTSGVNIGFGLSEFLKNVSVNSQPWRFEQVLLLFMLLLQYTIDQCNNERLITEAPVQILVQYMNPFMNYHIEDFTSFLQIDSLWIFKKQNMHNIFLCFYNWLKWKDYTQFCITLLD